VRVGLDFGTSNSSAAVYASGKVTPLPIERLGSNPAVLRTLLYIPRERPSRDFVLVGQEAIETYARQNTGRPVRYARKLIRVLEMTFAEVGTIQAPGYALIDENEPGRFFQSLKTFLRDRVYKGTSVFGEVYSLEDLVAAILREIRLRVEGCLGERVDGWTVGRPVRFSDDPVGNEIAQRRLEEACRRAGLEDVRFELEPIAAGRYYALGVDRTETALVFDFGGGTLDLTVLRLGGASSKWKVLAVDGVPVAGDVFDSRIVEGSLLEHFGLGAAILPERRPFPVHIPYALADWPSIVALNKPETLETIRDGRRRADRRSQIAALECLVTRNHGLAMYEEVRRAKARLSRAERDWVTMNVEEIHFAQEITRGDFESHIAPERKRIDAAVDRVIAAAGLEPAQIDVVLRTGGSSSIPWFIKMLERKVGRAADGRSKVVERDLFTSVADGLALAAAGHDGLEEAS
jgi:hypothetical chaperone protein